MQKDGRDLLDIFKFELEFLEKGGYGRPLRESWRPQFIFEDSPTCMNYGSKNQPGPCSECVLMQLVPLAFREAKIPCRHIPLNPDGETLDSLYRWGDQQEIEETVQNWLRATIARLEEERRTYRDDQNKPLSPTGGRLKGVPLYQKLHPKCANPGCPTAFHWQGGGRFFRFRSDYAARKAADPVKGSPNDVHGVKHFWLCERCSRTFTLVYDEQFGVELKLLRPEFSIVESQEVLMTNT